MACVRVEKPSRVFCMIRHVNVGLNKNKEWNASEELTSVFNSSNQELETVDLFAINSFLLDASIRTLCRNKRNLISLLLMSVKTLLYPAFVFGKSMVLID